MASKTLFKLKGRKYSWLHLKKTDKEISKKTKRYKPH